MEKNNTPIGGIIYSTDDEGNETAQNITADLFYGLLEKVAKEAVISEQNRIILTAILREIIKDKKLLDDLTSSYEGEEEALTVIEHLTTIFSYLNEVNKSPSPEQLERILSTYPKINTFLETLTPSKIKRLLPSIKMTPQEEAALKYTKEENAARRNGSPKEAQAAKKARIDRVKAFLSTLALYDLIKLLPRKTNRTRDAVENITKLPERMAIITVEGWEHALDFIPKGSAYLKNTLPNESLKFSDGKLYFNGNPATEARLKDMFTDENIEKIDLPLLSTFYSIILNEFNNNITHGAKLSPIIEIYVPDFAEAIGKGRNVNANDIQSIIDKATMFQTVVGIKKTERGEDILPVLTFEGYYSETNTFKVSSPYIINIILSAYKAAVRRNKKGEALRKKDETPQLTAWNSFLIKSSIATEKNKAAVANVETIIRLIEQAGSPNTRKGEKTKTANISVGELINRNPLLKKQLETADSSNKKNIVLSRNFKKTFELLHTQTYLFEIYKEVKIGYKLKGDPGAAIVYQEKPPTSKTMNKTIYLFTHKGKK